MIYREKKKTSGEGLLNSELPVGSQATLPKSRGSCSLNLGV